MVTLEQKRAKFALEKIQDAKSKLDSDKKFDAFVNLAKGSSALVMNNGLMASLAFWKSREKEPAADRLLEAVLAWLKDLGMIADPAFDRAMGKIVAFPSVKYMQATQETLEFLKWLRQLAAAMKSGD